MKNTEQYILDTLNERIKLLLTDSEVVAEMNKQGTVEEAKEWIQWQAMSTLMFSPEERAAHHANK